MKFLLIFVKELEAVYLHIKRLGILVFVILIILIIPVSALFASGNREDRLPEAEKLIDERKYNDAILLLTEMLKREPARIDEIQELLTRVREEKDKYNNLYEDLIDTYGGDNIEAAYPIIKQLEELDPLPNEATRESLVLARETAGFVFNNNRWVDIMERGKALLTEEQYDQAVRVYMEGFDLSRDIFSDAGYGNIIENEIFARAEETANLSEEFIELYPGFKHKSELVEAFYSERNISGFIASVNSLYTELLRLAELRNELKTAAEYFIIQENNIRLARGDDKQVHYLIYLDRLLNGRTVVSEREGITGAVELIWNKLYLLAYSQSVALAAELFDSAGQYYEQAELARAQEAFEEVVNIAESALETLNIGMENIDSGSESAAGPLLTADEGVFESDLYFLRDCINASISFQEIIIARRTLDEYGSRLLVFKEGEDTGEDAGEDDGRQLKADLFGVRTKIEEQLVPWKRRDSEIDDLEGRGVGIERSASAVEQQIDILNSLSEESLQSEIELTALLIGRELTVLEEEYNRLSADTDESRQLLDGIPAEGVDVETEFEVVYKYPRQAAERITETEAKLYGLVEAIRSTVEQIAGERNEIKTGPPVTAVAVRADELANRSGELLSLTDALGSRARDQIFAAEKLKQEGERRIEESKLLTRQAQFQGAKARLENAAQKFDESLSYMEDLVLRKFRDEEIPRLYEEIQTAENNLVVKQVREYLTDGKSSYSQGNFAAARNVLIKAQNRWSDTNIEPNAEVEYWLTLTQTALSVTSGRVIAETDPLFTEMSQYLNQAKADFLKAKSEYSSGRQDEADLLFQRAEQSILFVQQFFPFNEEARVLNLRISQYREPEKFNEIFKSDFLAARRLISSNPQKAYIDLKDLEAINPSFPGLRSAIIEAEYATGIKVRPPDPEKLRKSDELYQLAFSIVSRNIRSEFNVALSYLDEAISLNNDNIEAIRLKDRISADVGGTATTVMSSSDQQLYQEAVNEYTAGNYLKARIIVENLLKNPDNQRNTRLIELKERIERTR